MSEVETTVSDEPSIDWEAALDQFVSVQAEETIDLSDEFDGASAELEQFLGRDADLRYFLLSRRTTPDEQSISRTFIPTPLKCRISKDDKGSTHLLEIRPDDASGVVHEQTRLLGEQWTSAVTKGSPEVVVVKSLDLPELQQARVELVGPERAKREAEAEALALASAATAGGAALASVTDSDADAAADELSPAAEIQDAAEAIDTPIEVIDDVEDAVDEVDAVEEVVDQVEAVEEFVDEVDEVDDLDFLDDVDEVEELDDVEAIDDVEEVDEIEELDDDSLFEDDIEVIDDADGLIEVIEEDGAVEVIDDVEAIDELEEFEAEETDADVEEEEYEYEYEYVEEEEEADADAAPDFDIVDEDAEEEVDDVEPGAFDFLNNE